MERDNTNSFKTALKAHFELDADHIAKLCEIDEDFKEIVMDYLFCFEEMIKLKDQNQLQKKLEFEETLKGLKRELYNYLDQYNHTDPNQ